MSELEATINQSVPLYKKAIGCIDVTKGAITAGIFGGMVFGINYEGDIPPAAIAAVKQGAYSFLFGGVLAKSCEYYAGSIKKPLKSAFYSVVFPTLITLVVTYGIHNLKGTEKPIKSTIPTAILAPIGLTFLYKRKRKELYKVESDNIS